MKNKIYFDPNPQMELVPEPSEEQNELLALEHSEPLIEALHDLQSNLEHIKQKAVQRLNSKRVRYLEELQSDLDWIQEGKEYIEDLELIKGKINFIHGALLTTTAVSAASLVFMVSMPAIFIPTMIGVSIFSGFGTIAALHYKNLVKKGLAQKENIERDLEYVQQSIISGNLIEDDFTNEQEILLEKDYKRESMSDPQYFAFMFNLDNDMLIPGWMFRLLGVNSDSKVKTKNDLEG